MAEKMDKCISCLKENMQTLFTFVGVLIGVGLGLGLKNSREEPWSPREAMYVKFIGELFLNMLKCIIIPLVVPSLIAAIGSMDVALSAKIGIRAIVFYMTTTLLAVILGIGLVLAIRPGDDVTAVGTEKSRIPENISTADTLMDLPRNCFPPNIIQATVQQYHTALIRPEEDSTDPLTGAPILTSDLNTWMTEGKWNDNSNILGLVVFSVVTGIVIAKTGEHGRPLLRFFQSVSFVMMKITSWIILLAPAGVCFLVAGQLLAMRDIAKEFQKIGWYFLVVIVGLAIHAFLVLPLLYTIICRKLPFRFIANLSQALMTAWGTSSSSATLPVTFHCLEEKNGVDPRVARLVLPIGATVNMDGTALYEAVAAIFIAQMNDLELSVGQILAISITATAASIGAAGIPQAGLVTMVMVLDTVGLPGDLVSLIISMDWLLDRFRTTTNVLGDSIGTGIVDHLSREDIKAMDDMEDDTKKREEDHEHPSDPSGSAA